MSTTDLYAELGLVQTSRPTNGSPESGSEELLGGDREEDRTINNQRKRPAEDEAVQPAGDGTQLFTHEELAARKSKKRRLGISLAPATVDCCTSDTVGAHLQRRDESVDTQAILPINPEPTPTILERLAVVNGQSFSSLFVGNGGVYINNLVCGNLAVTDSGGNTATSPIILAQVGPFVPTNSQQITLKTVGASGTYALEKPGDYIEITILGQTNATGNTKSIYPIYNVTLVSCVMNASSSQPFTVKFKIPYIDATNVGSQWEYGQQSNILASGNYSFPTGTRTANTAVGILFGSTAAADYQVVSNITAVLYKQ